MAPPINVRERTVVLNRRGGVVYVRIVHTQQGSVEVLQVTRSLLLLIIVCNYIVLHFRSYCEFLRVTGLFPESVIQLVCFVGDYRLTLSVYHISGVMAYGDSRPEADRSGVSFQNQLQVEHA